MKYFVWIVFSSIIVLAIAGIISYFRPKLIPEIMTILIVSPIPPVP